MDPYSSGERVFGPPRGTFDADWAATALRSLRPELDHPGAVRLVTRGWDLVRLHNLRGPTLVAELRRAGDLEPGLADAVGAVVTETAELYLDRS